LNEGSAWGIASLRVRGAASDSPSGALVTVKAKDHGGAPGSLGMTYPRLFASSYAAARRGGRVSFGAVASHKLQPLKVQLVASFGEGNEKA